MPLLQEKEKRIIKMKNKQLKKALKSNTPINSLYALIPAGQRDAFKKFAAMFGFNDEKIKKILVNEKN